MIDEAAYREILEEHARNPKFDDELLDFTHRAEYKSPQTGNICKIKIKLDNEFIREIGLKVEGSALANASASLLAMEIIDLSVTEVKTLLETLLTLFREGEQVDLTGELCVYESIRKFPERYDCALLPWRALSEALSI